ncbi:pilin outer membrane usher protein SafC [Citrobacter amalonaticus]|uniref:Pilin outer membrane usher protein SafC n=1 Tax=Citrobacter amalonaticus TaxID=35703 RepID=A0A2S4RXT4_CITAM|nr:fimbria/pilus outer membrane usher protein [Citrobacter amalonaticus]POT56171.1 pilin outer membrane usher protein SafC [Citrobacter amalonaticus]POT74480.1 pilin outer membrane usher protein SafC [Citrobacter amalonaticus]POU65279.1 pilin outer membrane usher protein SafC [Citrobacter amalonaticus]POV04114.1 pilin outer membrane usher protein SafC [Citrobacter amalonaticus]
MRRAVLSVLVGLLCVPPGAFAAANSDYTFNTDAFGKGVAVSQFNQAGYEPPGVYLADILLNSKKVASREVNFHSEKQDNGRLHLVPCLPVSWLSDFGVRVEDYPQLAGKTGTSDKEEGTCANLSAIPLASAEYDFAASTLSLDIPQVALRPEEKGVAPMARWDDGIPAVLLGYNANESRTETRGSGGSSTNSQYLRLQPGANLGPWRFRNATTWSKSGHDAGKWETSTTYLERGINQLKGRLTMGDLTTSQDMAVFDGVPLRGVQLATDTSMLPTWMREFSPVVRGIARTHARVTVRQNGYSIYSEMVAPGPFELKDLQPGSSGELDVTVEEEDGSTQHFTVANSSQAVFLRRGAFRYGLAAGFYRPSGVTGSDKLSDAKVLQGTAIYGLPMNLTIYGGIQMANHYQGLAVGLGTLLGKLGAASVDVVRSAARLADGSQDTGSAVRLRYSKTLDSTGTSFTLSDYRYGSKGYHDMAPVLDSYVDPSNSNQEDGAHGVTPKERLSMSLSQSLGKLGNLGLSWWRNGYRGRRQTDQSYSARYSFSLLGSGVSLYATQTKNAGQNDGAGHNERQFGVNVSVPLSRWLPGTSASWQTTSSSGKRSDRLNLYGSAADNRLNWNVQQGYQPSQPSDSNRDGYAGLNWRGGDGTVNAGYSYTGDQYRTWNLGVSGGLLLHEHGITAGQSVDGTQALVSAPGVSGVGLSSSPGVKTDYRGYALQGYMSPYQENTVSLDSLTLAAGDEVKQTDMKVVPTKGAVMAVRYPVKTGLALLLKLARSDGKALPFGAMADLETENPDDSNAVARNGIVGDNGEVYMAGMPEKGTVNVRWGSEAGESCKAAYSVSEEMKKEKVVTLKAVCRAE